MMDLTLFAALLQNLLHSGVYAISDGGEKLRGFEEKFCYDAKLQPLFTASILARLFADVEDHILYQIDDAIGVCAIFFRFAHTIFLVGPFVRTEFDEKKVRAALILNQVPASYVPSIKLYYSAFPLTSSSYAQNTILACIRAFSGEGADYSICRLDDAVGPDSLPQPNYSESLDYSSLYTRYSMENHFLRLVEAGDTENVLMAYRNMALQSVSSNRYINAIYQDPVSSLSIVRALVRKAAENGGASIVEINEITQRALQRAVSSNHGEKQAEITENMILELTDAVRRKKLRLNQYTSPIQRVVEYLHLNYSQKIPLSKLAELAALSDAYLTREFKKEVGMTITQYIAHLRCEQAAQLLRDSDTPIQDISSFVGYTDNNYFVKVFKKLYGTTPSDYRVGQGS